MSYLFLIDEAEKRVEKLEKQIRETTEMLEQRIKVLDDLLNN